MTCFVCLVLLYLYDICIFVILFFALKITLDADMALNKTIYLLLCGNRVLLLHVLLFFD